VPSASQNFGGHKPAARYNIFSIDTRPEGGWSCLMEEHGVSDASERITKLNERVLY